MTETSSQTAGPYLHIGLLPNASGLPMYGGADVGSVIAGPEVEGERIAVRGRVLDGEGQPAADAMVEAWQADPQGRFPPDAARGFHGFGRSGCDADGVWTFQTVRPGPVGGASFLTLMIFARGIGLGLHTRMYWPGSSDAVLAAAGDRAGTLVAEARDGGLWFDIRLQGEGETVFLDV
ncbi:protocatechuate 3,4-dioxygenase subunit alpha [Jannaschia sp. Os4]|uniref:protocatechuate 3,4-dioxygenase subunit alpha n=1 Tax=Jannaschia sp. Os4 TaxID=2807617 RepID=UPI00193A8AEC|nr:protocatechuate 3,4-dioxygenase subunit alpha [Jannaschia sp. Os4]MBM2575134.1 protocatechuate 3,4-dioxygenase subunit alpha [Jannaschia sp. Os4]